MLTSMVSEYSEKGSSFSEPDKKTGAFKPTRWARRFLRSLSPGFSSAACPRGRRKSCHSEGPADFRFANHGIRASSGTDFGLLGATSLYPRRPYPIADRSGKCVQSVRESLAAPKMYCLVLERTALIPSIPGVLTP